MAAGFLALTFAWHPEGELGCSFVAAIIGAGIMLIGYRADVSRSRAKLPAPPSGTPAEN